MSVCPKYVEPSGLNPFYNSLLVGGLSPDGSTYLGHTDMRATHFQETYAATGFGQHLALPILRNDYKEDMTLEEAKALMEKVMRVLYYRDCRASRRYQVMVATDGKISSETKEVSGDWSVA